MATRSRIKKLALRGGNPQGSLARYNTCSCHPQQYGLKKALRRARRRVDREVILLNLDEIDVGTASTLDP